MRSGSLPSVGSDPREAAGPRAVRGSETRSELVVFWTRGDPVCDECAAELPGGGLLRVQEGFARCMDCADLDHLVFLPRGDAALTRRAKKHSALWAVVVRWSRSRKRYERQGLLVEEAALHRAEEECLSDADRREARRIRDAERRAHRDREHLEAFARAIRERFPGCPAGVDLQIADRACEKHSGRVGRSAAAKALAGDAIDLAVRAHVRHRHTAYDEYLMGGWDRDDARRAVGGEVEGVLAWWRGEDPS